MENAVSESIWKSGYKARYYRRSNGTGRVELDFVIQLGDDLTFIEVKTGRGRGSASLDKGIELFHPDRAIKFEDGNIHYDGTVEHYPLFACAFLRSMERPREPMPRTEPPPELVDETARHPPGT